LTLDVHANLATRLDDTPAADEAGETDDGDEEAAAAPLALAIDLGEPAAEGGGDAPAATPAA
ncbi:MAG TPA: hypothetical protein PK306_21380, partial [Aquabacterium sp.]|nr:hypothetical protein [Aquabacterium sp.]